MCPATINCCYYSGKAEEAMTFFIGILLSYAVGILVGVWVAFLIYKRLDK